MEAKSVHAIGKMQSLSKFANTQVQYLFTDIDDTLTDQGQLHADAYQALWTLQELGVTVVPVTGRPAGWCEMIARLWRRRKRRILFSLP